MKVTQEKGWINRKLVHPFVVLGGGMRFFLQRSIDGELWTTIWTHHNLSFAKRGIYWYKRSTRLKWKYRVIREDQV